MYIESVRTNERVKAIANMCDNAALALFIAGVVQAFNNPNIFAIVDFAVGLVLMWIAWHVRGLIESEE